MSMSMMVVMQEDEPSMKGDAFVKNKLSEEKKVEAALAKLEQLLKELNLPAEPAAPTPTLAAAAAAAAQPAPTDSARKGVSFNEKPQTISTIPHSLAFHGSSFSRSLAIVQVLISKTLV